MTDIWQEIIHQQQLEATTHYVASLTDLAVLTLSGNDTESFLQSMLTNDVSELAINQNHLTGLCNPKGRLIALFLLHGQVDGYTIILPKDICTTLLQRLTMYKLRSKVDISDDSETRHCLGLITADENAVSQLALAESQLLKLDPHRFIAIIPHDQADDVLNKAKTQNWQHISNATWNLYDIQSGLATIFTDTKETFTPQQLNLDLVGGVSFKKGCYPGQEVVARLHYLGSPSRRMFLAHASSSGQYTVGEAVKTSEGETAGHIVRGEVDNNNQLNLLISLKLSECDKDLVLNDSTPLTLITKTIPA